MRTSSHDLSLCTKSYQLMSNPENTDKHITQHGFSSIKDAVELCANIWSNKAHPHRDLLQPPFSLAGRGDVQLATTSCPGHDHNLSLVERKSLNDEKCMTKYITTGAGNSIQNDIDITEREECVRRNND